ncbi:magnesium/cobalt transporter CorA [Clostridium bowmanii]|uniref:magnesium/cobalt transporter CorA n=1 Tax=Clostridium bowmanii TaxID=132925 RepID=UPI001C0D484A|nr:magnesium/cobalt transporter CorA [Clostridium bowmanii]MBU3190108.1 magnesium/cobalt transporter CorA [Clostridium bowmanii]MCA1074703.1 magnesium/cobalt transporter CorA [Clostridium bowmanii]
MIRVIAITKDLKIVYDLPLEDLSKDNILWYWMDFNNPTEEEISLLSTHFHFHQLSIEDCVFSFNNPKLDYYDNYNYFVLNALNQDTLDPLEISLFVDNSYIVSYHSTELNELDEAWKSVKTDNKNWDKGPSYIAHKILDNIVDYFFPAINKIQDKLDEIENNASRKHIRSLMDEIFEIRSDLLKMRRTINSMRDLLYRITNSERLIGFHEHKLYFSDIYDHLVKLSDMIASNRELTSDMRDNYLSINSSRMNKHMMFLTVISSIFIPLTFIVGVYGMNFEIMPELTWKYGYLVILLIMAIIAIEMFFWFKRKGWFDM